MTIPETVTGEWLEANCTADFTMHLNAGAVHTLGYRVILKATGAPIGISIAKRSYKKVKSNGPKAGKTEKAWSVDAVPGDAGVFDTRDECLDAFNRHRCQLVRDAEFDAAAKGPE